jgi:hypothetical protein
MRRVPWVSTSARGPLIVAMIVVIGGILALPAGSAAASKWSVMQLPAKQLEGGTSDQVPLNGVSCPSPKLCVAVGALDTVAVSRSPTGGRDSWLVSYPKYAEPKSGRTRLPVLRCQALPFQRPS